MGTGLSWTVFRNGAPLPSMVSIVTSYYPPVVYSMLNNTNLPSEGGKNIILIGELLLRSLNVFDMFTR